MKSKRVLSLVLAVCLALSVLTPGIYAVPTESGSTAAESGTPSVVTENKNNVTSSATGGASLQVTPGKTFTTLRDKPLQGGSDDADDDGLLVGSWSIQATDSLGVSLLDEDAVASIEELKQAAEIYDDNDTVAAFVVMDGAPLSQTYSSIGSVSAYSERIVKMQQDAVIASIENEVLDGEELDVRYQFTYLANAFSVRIAFGELEKIAAMDGVKSVYLMPVYDVCEVEQTDSPLTSTSSNTSGASSVWVDLGYTGAGMKIAVIDTGLDLDHPSFYADPKLTDSSLTVEDIDAVLSHLNASTVYAGLTAEALYRSAKVPYAFNYVDENLTADHSSDGQGDHGTHVAGIAAANETEGTSVVGMAPDAQLVIMKVFGQGGGAYADDIVAALEDALTLDCDVINMSLGSSAGFSASGDEYVDEIYASVAEQDVILAVAAGNDGTSGTGNNWGKNQNTTDNVDNAAVSSPATYANTTVVASVDNAMIESNYFTLDGQAYGYNNAQGLSITFESLADLGELEYVMVPGLGYAEDFEGVDVDGKIAVIARGTINFSTKIANAEAAGAIGVIITNNEPGSIATFGMSVLDEDGNLAEGLSDTVPAVLVTMDCGTALAASETKKITVSATTDLLLDPDGGQISSFSSWGAAPDLRLLPDVAGVGGNVYSTVDDGEYDFMSGTSMATPQVAGLSALILQYLHTTFPKATDTELRTLANALLMSTAVPVVSNTTGLESSPRQQGAGVANAWNAVTSGAYLSVAGSDKPKAELGDNADGTYTFTFTVHNFSDSAKHYTLSSSLLTEATVTYDSYEGVEFMAGYETELDGTVSFSKDSVTVPANSSVEISVTVAVSADGKAWLEQHYPNGGYVEGYIYLESTDEGGVDLSLPYLGFYGDWTEAPTFDSGYWYDAGCWFEDVDEVECSEYYHLLWTDLGSSSWFLGINPYTGPLLDESGELIYSSDCNVISNNGDGLVDNITDIYVSLMRNAKKLTITYTDESGNVLDKVEIENASKSMYSSYYGQPIPFVCSWYADEFYDFTDENGDPLPNNTKLILTISAWLEDPDDAGESIVVPITIDTQAPKLIDAYSTSENGVNYLNLTISENAALADVLIYSASGTHLLAEQAEYTKDEDGNYVAKVDVTGCGTQLTVILGDYGCNESAWSVTFVGEDGDENLPKMDTTALYAYQIYNEDIYYYGSGYDYMFGWTTIDKDTAEVEMLSSDAYEYYSLTAAEYAGGYVFGVDAGYNLVVMTPGLWDRQVICNLGLNVVDMAFDDTTDTMYLATSTDGEYALYAMDIMTTELTLVGSYYSKYSMPWVLTVVDGTIYAIESYSSYLYTVDKDYGYLTPVMTDDGEYVTLTDSDGNAISPVYSQSMTYSKADNKIYYAYYRASYYGSSSYDLITIDMTDLSSTAKPFACDSEYVGLLTLEETEFTVPESDHVDSISLSSNSLVMAAGSSVQLSALPLPWNAPLTEVVWASADPSIATVDADGIVTGISEGKTTVTVKCGEATASCTVTVVEVNSTVYGYRYYDGYYNYGDWFSLELNGLVMDTTVYSDVDLLAADYNGHDGYIYGYDDSGNFYRCDPATGVCELLGKAASVPADMAYDYSTGLMYAIVPDYYMGGTVLYYVDLRSGELFEAAESYYSSYLTLACGTDGTLYAIDYYGELYSLALGEYGLEETYIMDILGGLGAVYYQQSMCYDHNAQALVWAYCEGSTIYYIDVNAEEPYALALGDPTGTGFFEFTGLYSIPSEIPELPYTPAESISAQDILVLVGGTKAANVTVWPLNATSQSLTWSSADTGIATVDENGVVTAVSEGVTTVTVTLDDAGNTLTTSFQVTVKPSAGDIYGYVMADFATNGGGVWTVFPDTDPGATEYPNYSDYTIVSEEYVDGKLYAFGYSEADYYANYQFIIMDAETYQIEKLVDMGGNFPWVYDLSYDYVTGTMFALAGYGDTASDLYVVNMETGELFLAMETEPFFMALAVSPDGTVYAISSSEEYNDWWTGESGYTNAQLYILDPAAGTYELAFDLGVQNNMLSTMAFDFDTGNLYWSAVFRDDSWTLSGGLYLIDLDGQAAYDLGDIGASGTQLTGMYILADEYPEVADELFTVYISSAQETLAVGGTQSLSCVVSSSAVDAETVWTSSDEEVVTVDGDGNITAVSGGVALVTVTASYKGSTVSASCIVFVFDENDNLLSYNTSTGGWAAIDRNDPTQVESLTTETAANVRAAALVDGKIYAYDEENNFFTASVDDLSQRTYLGGAHVEIPESNDYYIYSFVIRDLAYDVANGRMLALGCTVVEDTEYGYSYETTGGCIIYQVDMKTGELTELCTPMQDGGEMSYVKALTVDLDGTAYLYETASDYIGTVDLETGNFATLCTLQSLSFYGDSGVTAPMAMAFDPVTCKIYFLFTSNGSYYYMLRFDPVTKSVTVLGNVGEVNSSYNYDTWSYDYDAETFAGLVIDAVHTHVISEVPAADPTCTKNGNIAYWHCPICGKYFLDEGLEKETTLQEVIIPATGHDYGEPVWNWTKTEDGYTATATFTCGNDASHVVVLDATVVAEVTDPTCTEDGIIVYTATVELDSASYTDTRLGTLEAVGHDYGEPVWSWTETEDGYTATATFTCGNDASHVITLTATVVAKVTDPTSTEDGVIVYTATVELDGVSYTSSKSVVLEATGEPSIIIEGTDETYTKDSNTTAEIHCSADLDDFISVYVDGELVDEKNYTLSEGSTIITFTNEYLETLSVGEHTVTLVFTVGSVDTTLTVLENVEQNTENVTPDTGDTFSPIWIFVMLASATGAAALVLIRKKQSA